MISSTFKKSLYSFYIACNRSLHYSKHFPWFSLLFLLLSSKGLYRAFSTTELFSWAPLQQLSQTVVLPSFKKEKQTENQKIVRHIPQKESHIGPEPVIEKEQVATLISESLQPHLTAMEQKLVEAYKVLEALQKRQALLTQDIQLAHGRLDKVEKNLNHPVEATDLDKSSAAVSDLGQYSVYATVPGRAWVRTPQQGIITVRVGDHIPSLGVVQEVDRENGSVYLDQGRVIQPSPRDN